MTSFALVVVARTRELTHQWLTHQRLLVLLGGVLVILGVFLGGVLVIPFRVLVVSFRVCFGVVGRLSGSIMPGFGLRVVSPLGLTDGRTTDGIA